MVLGLNTIQLGNFGEARTRKAQRKLRVYRMGLQNQSIIVLWFTYAASIFCRQPGPTEFYISVPSDSNRIDLIWSHWRRLESQEPKITFKLVTGFSLFCMGVGESETWKTMTLLKKLSVST
ncbi:hypothetical protein BD408DRAFT_419718 [Parasitella parasitica]|nr:hypothetical protein BD408DRAFT_419718 [Parasitella parasitica]